MSGSGVRGSRRAHARQQSRADGKDFHDRQGLRRMAVQMQGRGKVPPERVMVGNCRSKAGRREVASRMQRRAMSSCGRRAGQRRREGRDSRGVEEGESESGNGEVRCRKEEKGVGVCCERTFRVSALQNIALALLLDDGRLERGDDGFVKDVLELW